MPLEAKRTLVKSPPELWAEVSDAGALARHLGEFGEIRITRVQPESVVEWEGDLATGSVQLEPSGWGTRVTLTLEGSDLAIQQTGSRSDGMQDLTPPNRGFWARLFGRDQPPEVAPPAPRLDAERAEATLAGVLDTLGAAHHRPFSRP